MLKKSSSRRNYICLIALLAAVIIAVTGCSSGQANISGAFNQAQSQVQTEVSQPDVNPGGTQTDDESTGQTEPGDTQDIPVSEDEFDLASVPAYSGEPYIEINGNVPYFTADELTTESYESYSALDSLGRCGVCEASVGKDIMPEEERGSIGAVRPTGWHTVKYSEVIEDNYLYNRCHLIGYQLTGENANKRNLITGTRYLNIQGMLPFENMVGNYVEETGNHVMYRVTPVFEENNLVASGVLMEGKSVETDDISFCVYCYNVQPGIIINYANGDSELDESYSAADETTVETTAEVQPSAAADNSQSSQDAQSASDGGETTAAIHEYVLNTNTHKFHLPTCSSVGTIKADNRQDFEGTREEVIARGFDPCGRCHP